jgi:uncharacterized protein
MPPTLAPTRTGTAQHTASSVERRVPTRRISFEESLADMPRHFSADGDLFTSHLMAVLSSVFPDGEDYFVRAVRRFRDQVEDPTLKQEVAGFIGQESVHGREHRVLNERLAELGYPTRVMARLAKGALAVRERVSTDRANLAVTAALEHFTATLAEAVMTDADLRQLMGHPAVRDVFVWHALEESEHKAVAFDVYRAVGGSERTRVMTMKGIRIGFIIGMTLLMGISLSRDPETLRRGRLRSSFRRFRSSPLMRREIWEQLREYDRAGFHPDDRDTSDLVEFWREELFGAEGRLNELLVGAAPVATRPAVSTTPPGDTGS